MMANKYKAASRRAQRREKRRRACERKQAYETEPEAYQEGQATYKCCYCGKWHRSGAFATLVQTLKARRG